MWIGSVERFVPPLLRRALDRRRISVDPSVPAAWTMIGEMRLGGALSGDTSRRYQFYARRPEDVAAASTALERFAPTLPSSVRLLQTGPGVAE